MQDYITVQDLDWWYENRHAYIGVCGECIHISEYPFIRYVLEKTNFTWEGCIPSDWVIRYCQKAIQEGKSKEQVVGELLEKNKIISDSL